MKNLHSRTILAIIIISFFYVLASCQGEKNYKKVSIGFYNLENLFDTIYDAELLLNEEFTPESPKQWSAERYQQKLTNMAFVISNMATDVTPDGLALLGVCEVENRGVLEDLVLEQSIKDRNYQVVHFDSPDKRGIDVGLLYNPAYFEVTNTKSYNLSMPDDSSFFTRDQLVVSGLLDGEKVHVIVNHWPSRRGGAEKSQPKRIAAGDLSRTIVDSLLIIDQNAKIFVMGDMNDDPVDLSVLEHLNAKGNIEELKEGDLFNPMFQLHADSLGTLSYRKKWNLFDMVIVSQGLLGESKSDYKFYKAEVFDQPYLRQTEGDYAGYPNRTYAGKYYLGGYSDHFPVYVYLRKEID
ncbi:MAG: endonuclease/exonuclease/phosphatase family protein [Deltaproteobacteria bacterium]|nr:MAG: endonuclease/exonuclease/phosphatase family protein [Deltaproteobacteria bacterium]